MIALVLIGFGTVALLQIPSLVRQQWWRELISFMVLWLAGFILSILLAIGVKILPLTTIISSFITHYLGI